MVAELIDQGKSNRQIADVIGTDEKTVRNVIAENSALEDKKAKQTEAKAKPPAENSAPKPKPVVMLQTHLGKDISQNCELKEKKAKQTEAKAKAASQNYEVAKPPPAIEED